MVALDFTTATVILIFSFALGKVLLIPLMIAVLMILYGISGIYQPAVQASIPLITEKQFLMQGNAVINMVSTLAGLLGPIIGGVLFGAFGIMPILFISISCFAFSAVMEVFIHIPFEKIPMAKAFLARWVPICRTALNLSNTKSRFFFRYWKYLRCSILF